MKWLARMHDVAGSGVTEEINRILWKNSISHVGLSLRNLRKLGYDVPKKPGAAPVFSAEETDALSSYLESNSGSMTAEEIAADFMGGKFTARQINGKALSLEMTSHVKPAEKKITPRTYSEDEEAKINDMASSGAFLEEIADAMGRSVNSIRGKLLSMGLKAPQRDKKVVKSDPYEGIEDMLDQTVEEIADLFSTKLFVVLRPCLLVVVLLCRLHT